MHWHRDPWCPLAPSVLLCLVLLAAASGQGPLECWEQAVSANGALHLQLEKPPQGWTKVTWRVRLDAGYQQRILTVEKYKADLFSNSTFFGRAVFQQETFSLQISLVSTADSGVYEAEFEDTSGTLTTRCFRVSVWEPVHSLHLETHILDWEQGWCNLSLVCTVSGAGNVSYSWSCSGDPWGALEHQPWLHLQVHGDADPTVCRCNVSNPVSWSTDSTNVTAASCQAVASGHSSIIPWWAVAVSLVLALAISIALIVSCYWWRKRAKDPPAGQVEQMLTVYEEVGKAQTGRNPNGTSEATVGGNTVYAVICTKMQGPSHPQEPKSYTIYSTVQPTMKSSSLKKKRLDPALVSTAYVEVTGTGPVGRQDLGISKAHQLFGAVAC
ncbi:natural killer cell receptor 2B4-like isoform X1 [Harpia harpyja]|uniref:natural killer cell receptor 2B4-like isoform X1 n=1 Tax=Harpia harpyja TaxID=202280 RepID=UPI0022B0B37D|nr:natural killer cell receptor 2B4-like isoform X1 [Harpia harpyja]